MVNLILHIVLPAGLKLISGAQLVDYVTFDIISTLTPFYSSVDQVKLSGGMYLRRTGDITIASEIFQASREADLITPYSTPQFYFGGFLEDGSQNTEPIPISSEMLRFVQARSQWVRLMAARNLMESIMGLIGNPATHVLANFSVTQGKGGARDGVQAKLDQLDKDIAKYEVTIRSNGATLPGGHVLPAMAAKGVFDFREASSGRTWGVTGMGANVTRGNILEINSVGGRGKAFKEFYSPFHSPSFYTFRRGLFQSNYGLTVI